MSDDENVQEETHYNKFLPYSDVLHKESAEWLQEIKTQLTKAVIYRELKPGIIRWLTRLCR